MNCIRCDKFIPDGSLFCCFCGKKQTATKRKTPKRGNGQGTAYKRGDTWTAQVVIGWRNGSPVKRTKGGFPTKKDAINYCPVLSDSPGYQKEITLQQLYLKWEKAYSSRIIKSTLGCYSAAFKHFAPLHHKFISRITANDLQKCMDDCTAGKRTHENMKCVAGLLWAYAIDSNFVQKDISKNLYIGKHETVKREPLTEEEISRIRDVVGIEPYADYIYCLCYLGFRPGELLALKKSDFITIDGIDLLVGGSKTEAGRGRRIVIPPQILDLVRARMDAEGTDLLFPQYVYTRGKNRILKAVKRMSDAYFREEIFKPLMKKLNIAEGKVPYCARHSFSDKLKNAEGSNKAKASLMGHTDYAFTQSHYQSEDLDDLLAVAVSLV